MSSTIPSRRWQLVLALALAVATLQAPAAEKTYRHFRFLPTKFRDPGQNLVQVSEFQFRLAGSPRSLAGVRAYNATGSAGDSPGGEQPEKSIDLSTSTKWLNWNGTAPGPGVMARGIDFDFINPVTIDEYTFATANDADGRDPVSWEFYGGVDADNNGVAESWDLLDVQIDHAVPTARNTYMPAPLVLPDSALPAILSFAATPEVVLDGASVTLNWNVAYASTVEIDPGVGPVAASGSAAADPPDNADTTYTLTATNAGGSVTASFTVRSVTGGAAMFRYYRFTQRQLRDGAAANSIQLADFYFINNNARLNLTALGVTTTNPGGNTPTNEGAANLCDANTGTKWLDFNRAPVVFDFGVPTEIDAYAFTTANDNPPRDPVNWLLEGSDDQVAWTMLDTMTRYPFPAPMARLATTGDIPLPGDSLVPDIQLFIGDAPVLVPGEPLVLTWATHSAQSVAIDQGIGSVAAAGTVTVNPAAGTTYTLTATGATRSATAQFTTTIATSGITSIAYDNFAGAGDELALLRSAAIVNAYPTVPEPGDFPRLRLTPDSGSLTGTAWFRKRIDASGGFDTTFGLHLVSPSGNGGADGMSFMLQNTPTGSGTALLVDNERGLPANSFNIRFDSYYNADPDEPSAAFLQVRAGATALATVNLAAVPGITLAGTNDLTDSTGLKAPYPVRVAYTPGTPGTLDVFFQGVWVVRHLPVDLAAMGAVDGSGTGYVGFSARTGGLFEAHDITSWYLTEGLPALPPELVAFAVNTAAGQATLTWKSHATRSYRITASTDLLDWSSVLASAIPGSLAEAQTSKDVSFTPGARLFFRVEEE